MSTAESQPFKAEIRQLLQILVHSLYQDRDIFVRELVSNASDALARLQFEMLTNREVHDADAELAIHIEKGGTEEQPILVIKDSGIGMTSEELQRNLGTIAQSGAREFLSKLEEGSASPTDIIGQFGVGFYSVFMVADEVRVVSRSFDPQAEAAQWISDGGETYRVESAEKAERGTEMHITLKKDAAEFADMFKLRQIIKKHSDFVSFPIYVDGEQANQQTPLWRRSASEISQEEYNQFYQQLSLDFQAPLTKIHFSSDSPVNIRALLYIPSQADRGMFNARREFGLKLYSNNVLIQEFNKELLPEWLRFVDGVVESEDVPLNVSRETVQNNRLMRQLGKILRKRVIRELTNLAKKEPEKFETFWRSFGRILKEGLAMQADGQDDVMPLLRYHSTNGDDLTSLNDYIGRMKAEQEAIYYVLGDGISVAANSPHLDPFKTRDWEVLYFTDPIDPFYATSLPPFEGKSFVNVESADLDIPADAGADAEEAVDPAEEKGFNLLVGRMVTTLGERVTEVRPSKRLTNSPVRLVPPENDFGMARIQRMLGENFEVPQRILEINRQHPIIVNLAAQLEANADAEVINLTIEQLYESGLLQEGLHPNPTTMLPRLQKLLELATASGL